MQCPRCSSYMPLDPDKITDTPAGLIATIDWPIRPHDASCGACGWTIPVRPMRRPNRKRLRRLGSSPIAPQVTRATVSSSNEGDAA